MDTTETYIKMCDWEEIQYYGNPPRIRKSLFDGKVWMFCENDDFI